MLSNKQKRCISHNGWATVYEGAVRSGKTVASLLQFYRRILYSPDNTFLMSGATMGSISRNCIEGDFGFVALTSGKAVKKVDADGNHYLSLMITPDDEKRVYYCGAENKGSYKRIRGLTIGGWYADEINLHHIDFIHTALGRSFASADRFNIWTLNPSAPSHFVYKDYIDKWMKLDGYLWQHYLIEDNPIITPAMLEQITAQYSGVFYDMFILGKRVRAEGACFPSFSEANILSQLPAGKMLYTQIGVDIGGSGSRSSFTHTGFFRPEGETDLLIIALDELYDDKRANTESVVKDFEFFAKAARAKHGVADTYTDSAEQLFKNSFEDLAIMPVYNSKKNKIVDRIRYSDLMFSRKRMFVMSHCTHLIDAIKSSVWDDKGNNDRLDDGTTNVDSLDSFEYSYESEMWDIV